MAGGTSRRGTSHIVAVAVAVVASTIGPDKIVNLTSSPITGQMNYMDMFECWRGGGGEWWEKR